MKYSHYFRMKVTEARWNLKEVPKIILVYLSPTSGTREATKGKIRGQGSRQDWYTTLFLCIKDLDALRDSRFVSATTLSDLSVLNVVIY